MVKTLKIAGLMLAFCGTAMAQGPGGAPGSPSPAGTSAGQVTAVQAAEQQLATEPSGTVTDPRDVPQTAFHGSVVEGKATAEVMDLTLADAIQRGLRTNLGVILQSSSEQAASAQRLQQLQALLPTLSGTASVEVEQVNLAAYGLKFPGINPIVGPFQVMDFRAYLTQSLFNLNELESYMASRHNFAAAKLSAEDARDMVALTVGNAYLLCIADASRVDSINAELATSKVSLDQATANHEAGTSPRLDVLRAQVDYQNVQQQLISAKNQLAKDKLALARTIGLPLAQEFRLKDTAPYAGLDNLDAETAFQQALKNRKDLAAAAEQLKAAESQKKAAFAEQLPHAEFTGDYGDIGTTPAHSHGSFTATGEVKAPILQIAKTRGDEQAADAQYKQQQARLTDQVQQVNADIRDAILDIQSAAKLVEAAKSNVDLAKEELSEAQDRFKAGVSDNLAVSQAQSETEQANDQYIRALYTHNVAKLSLARALGVAQTNYKDYLGGK